MKNKCEEGKLDKSTSKYLISAAFFTTNQTQHPLPDECRGADFYLYGIFNFKTVYSLTYYVKNDTTIIILIKMKRR